MLGQNNNGMQYLMALTKRTLARHSLWLLFFLSVFGCTDTGNSPLVFSNTSPPDNAKNVHGAMQMIRELENIIEMELVAGSQLFDSRTSLASIGGGIAGSGEVITSYMRSYLKHAVITNDLMYLGRSELVISAAATETLLRDCPECMQDFDDNNTLFLSGGAAGSYSMLCRDKVASLSDVKGKKFRAVGANRRWVRALGGVPVSLSITDMVEGLSRGLVSCIVGPIAWLKTFPITDEVNYVYAYNAGAFNFATMVINRDRWDNFTESQKQAMWQAQPGLSARNVIRLYIADAIRAKMLAREKGILVVEGGEDVDRFWEEFKQSEVEIVNELSESFGVQDPQRISDSFVSNIGKWQMIISQSNLIEVLDMEEIDESRLNAAVEEYTQLLRDNIYAGIDPLEL